METRKQANYALKTESVKNRTVCNDLDNYHTSATPKLLKKLDHVRNLYINLLQKESTQNHSSVKMRIIFMSARVSVFQQDQINYHPT